jgi:hypothetical protein
LTKNNLIPGKNEAIDEILVGLDDEQRLVKVIELIGSKGSEIIGGNRGLEY